MCSTSDKCPICYNAAIRKIFNGLVLKKYQAAYYFCDECQFLFAQSPSWLNEAYTAPINVCDTGMMARNISLSKKVATIIYFLFEWDARFLDYGGGYGIFTRLMRDIGFDFYWYDPYSTNLFARGFELGDGDSNFELLTCFEVLEHLVDPVKEIEKMFGFSDNILFSTQLLPSDIPQPNEWSYYGLEHGQHISFYSLETLQFIAKKFDCNLYPERKSLFLLTKRKLNILPLKILLRLLGHQKLFSYVKKQMKSKTDEDSSLLTLSKERNVL